MSLSAPTQGQRATPEDRRSPSQRGPMDPATGTAASSLDLVELTPPEPLDPRGITSDLA